MFNTFFPKSFYINEAGFQIRAVKMALLDYKIQSLKCLTKVSKPIRTRIAIWKPCLSSMWIHMNKIFYHQNIRIWTILTKLSIPKTPFLVPIKIKQNKKVNLFKIIIMHHEKRHSRIFWSSGIVFKSKFLPLISWRVLIPNLDWMFPGTTNMDKLVLTYFSGAVQIAREAKWPEIFFPDVVYVHTMHFYEFHKHTFSRIENGGQIDDYFYRPLWYRSLNPYWKILENHLNNSPK